MRVLPARTLKSMSGRGSHLVVGLELGDELEEEAQLADLDGLFHDVDAVEVVQHDGLEDEVPLAGVFFDLFQDGAEVAERPGAAAQIPAFAGMTEVVEEAAHPLEAGGVEGFEDIEGREEECAGAAGGVEDGHAAHGVPEGAEQLGALAQGKDVPGELFHVEVEGDEVVDLPDFARGEPGADLVVSLAAGDDLAPGLGGEGRSRRGRACSSRRAGIRRRYRRRYGAAGRG